ncbi:unnamed protein product, partial [Medioppia subpectinata]
MDKRRSAFVQSVTDSFNYYLHFRIKGHKTDRKFSTSYTTIGYFRQKKAVYKFLQSPTGPLGRAYHNVVITLIIVCLLMTIISTFNVFKFITDGLEFGVDILVVFVYVIEFGLRLWSSTCVSRYRHWRGRLVFIAHPFRVIDIVVIVTSILMTIFYITNQYSNKWFINIRFFHTFKLVRLQHRFKPWDVLASVLRTQRTQLYITLYISFLALLFTSFLIYYVERDANPMFNNMGQSLWYTIITFCTIGYGDIYPQTTLGKLLASICAAIGVSLFALPAGILGVGLALKIEEQQRLRQMVKRRIPAAKLIQSKWRYHRFDRHFTLMSVGVRKAGFQWRAVSGDQSPHPGLNEAIWMRFALKTTLLAARRRFGQSLKPYDVKDVLEQYSSGHTEMLAKVKQIYNRVTGFESMAENGFKCQLESKNVLIYRLSKVEDGLRDTQNILNQILNIQTENKKPHKDWFPQHKCRHKCEDNKEAMDQLTIVREFASLAPVMADRELCRRVRLLAAFGFNGSEVLFVTAEDNAYCFGPNRFGCLGLGIDADTPVDAPRLNRHLSGVQLANLYYGFGHCIGLTACGQLYAWGENTYGQLGIGSFETTPTPVVITAFTKKRVVDITCGNRHTLALTSDGLVYGWGRNTFGQIGDGTWCWRQWPTPVSIDEPISAISCGKCHSLALSTAGRLYVWGLNDFGQLGRHRDNDMKHFADGRVKERAFGECPEPVDGFEDTVVRKACCGPNHTLMLTAEGDIYAFGFNDFGQIGNGCHDNQYTPLKVDAETKFKDIVAHYDNNLSIGVSVDDKYWVWGFNYKKKKISKPYNVSKWTASYTLVDVFARYSGISKT